MDDHKQKVKEQLVLDQEWNDMIQANSDQAWEKCRRSGKRIAKPAVTIIKF